MSLKAIITAITLGSASLAAVQTADASPRDRIEHRDIRADRRDIRHDRRDIRADRRDIRVDRARFERGRFERGRFDRRWGR
jgi:hypothetical protein